MHQPTTRFVVFTAAAGLCAAIVAAAWAQERKPAPTTRPTTQPTTRATTRPTALPVDPEAAKRAKPIIDQALAKYRGAKTYADKLVLHFEVVASDKDGQDVGQNEEQAAKVAFAKPNRLALESEPFSIHCDGKQLWLYLQALGQYTEGDAPEKLDLSTLGEEITNGAPPHPVLFIMTRPDEPFEKLFPMVKGFTAVKPEERDGKAGTRISGVFDASATPFEYAEAPLPFTVWIDGQSGLLGELRLDLTPVYRNVYGLSDQEGKQEDPDEKEEMPGAPKKIDRAGVTVTFRDVKLDGDVSPDRFVFRPDKDAKKVKEFDFNQAGEMKMPDPKELIGKPFPAFSGTLLDEKPLTLADLKGQVVVLDFWATWCGPCVQAVPQIQKLAEQFAGKPVAVIGVNQDRPADLKKVTKFVADKKLTFRQYLDSDGKLGRECKIAAIPCTIVIDGKGIVQAVHVGFSPELGKELGQQIEKVLKGENLFKPGESPAPGEKPEKPEQPAKPEKP